MAKIKFDTKQIKEMFSTRHELLAVVVAGFLAVVCLIWGFSNLLSAGSSSPDASMEKDAKQLASKRDNAPPPQEEPPPDPTKDDGKGGDPKKGPKKDKGTPLSAWGEVRSSDAQLALGQPYFQAGAAGSALRYNPQIARIDSGPKAFQIDAVYRGVYTYQVNETKGTVFGFGAEAAKDTKEPVGGTPTTLDPVFLVHGKRMIVVTGTFPYHEQVEMYRKALRLERKDEVFTKGLQPTFEGLNVERRKMVMKDGKAVPGNWEVVYMHEPPNATMKARDRVEDADTGLVHWIDPVYGKMSVRYPIEKLLREALYDEREVSKYVDVLYGSSVSPLPQLASRDNKVAEYPEVNLPGVVNRLPPSVDKSKDGDGPGKMKQPFGSGRGDSQPQPPGMPGAGGPGGGEQTKKIREFAYDKCPQWLQDQLNGKINFFSPYGQYVDDPTAKDPTKPLDDKGIDPDRPPIPKDPQGRDQPKNMPPPGRGGEFTPWDNKTNFKAPSQLPPNAKAMIRFVDVDVEPGAVYQYRIQVRLANPNYKLSTKFVAYSGLSRIKELVSEWTETQWFNVPSDYQYYLINQEKFVTDAKVAKNLDIGSRTWEGIADKVVPVQIHKFVDTFKTKDDIAHYAADWVIAERIWVARGEMIGRKADVQLVEWDFQRSQWRLGAGAEKLDPKKAPKATALEVDFRTEPPVVLLDFVGGKQINKLPKSTSDLREDCAIEALLLMPDLTMKVKNQRDDTDDRDWNVPKDRPGIAGSPVAIERQQRFHEWKDRLEAIRNPPKDKDGKDKPPKGGDR
jgi:hypothetical protein